MKQPPRRHPAIGLSFFFGTSALALSQLTWAPTNDSEWNTSSLNWNDGVSSETWDNSGGEEAIFPDDAALNAVAIADGGITVGDLNLSLGSQTLTLSSITDNLGILNIATGGGSWNLGGRTLVINNNQVLDTPLNITNGDTLTVAGGGIFATGVNPNGADWGAEGATLEIADAVALRGAANTVGQFGLIRMAPGSSFRHERNANQTYTNSWESPGMGNFTVTNRWQRSVFLDGVISGTGGISFANLNTANGGGNSFVRLNNPANSFEGGVIVDATNTPSMLIALGSDRVLGALPSQFDADNITLVNGGRIRLQGVFDLEAKRGITLDGGGVVISNGSAHAINGPISGTGDFQLGYLSDGSANVILLNAEGSDYDGNTIIQRGTLRLGVAGALPSSSVVMIGNPNGGSGNFDLNSFDQTIGGLQTTNNNTRQILTNGISTLTIEVAEDESYSYTGNAIGDGTISIIKQGLGEQVLQRPEGYTSQLGDISVLEGQLSYGISDDVGDVFAAAGATLNLVFDGTTRPASFFAEGGSKTIYNWEINDWTSGEGTGWPFMSSAGDISISDGAAIEIVITEDNLANFSNETTQFVIARAPAGSALDLITSNISIDNSGFTSGEGSWDLSIIEQELVLTFNPTASTSYGAFAASFPNLIGGIGADDDGDGLSNGEEWYFGGSDPTDANDTASGRISATTAENSQFSFTHLRPADADQNIVSYEWSQTLEQPFTANGESDGTLTVTIIPNDGVPAQNGYESITVTTSADPATVEKLFFRLILTLAE